MYLFLPKSSRYLPTPKILGSSSDHIILDSNNYDLKVGTEVKFHLDYGSLLGAMTSPFITKQFIK